MSPSNQRSINKAPVRNIEGSFVRLERKTSRQAPPLSSQHGPRQHLASGKSTKPKNTKRYLENKCSRNRKKKSKHRNQECKTTATERHCRSFFTSGPTQASGFRTAPPGGRTDCCLLEDLNSSLPKVHFDGKLLTCGGNNEAPAGLTTRFPPIARCSAAASMQICCIVTAAFC